MHTPIELIEITQILCTIFTRLRIVEFRFKFGKIQLLVISCMRTKSNVH